MNTRLFAEALRQLANALETPADAPAQPPAQPTGPAPGTAPPTEPPKTRGRGRPPKAEFAETPAPAPATVEADPFAPPSTTLEQVRAALTALKAATTQEIALGILKTAGGADNLSALTSDKYAAVVAAVNFRLQPSGAPTPEAEDPFAIPGVQTEPEQAAPSIEDVKAAVVAAQKITSTDTVQKVVMSFGGVAPTASGAPGPSLKALPVTKYAEVIKAIQALPKTK